MTLTLHAWSNGEVYLRCSDCGPIAIPTDTPHGPYTPPTVADVGLAEHEHSYWHSPLAEHHSPKRAIT